MTKGYMAEYDENLSAADTSNLARRFVIEDCALRYQISLQMAEKLIRNNVAVVPRRSPKTRPDLEARERYPCRPVDRHGHRNSVNEVEEMAVDGCEERKEMAHGSSEAERMFPRTREELFHAGKPLYYARQPQVSSFVENAAMPKSGHSFARRPPHFADTRMSRPQANPSAYNPFVYPYYVFGYPPCVPRMAFRRHPVPGNKHSELLYSRLRDVPTKSIHGDQAPPETSTVVRPEEERRGERRNSGGKNRLVILPEGRSLFAARRNMDSSESVNSQETSLQTSDDSRNSNEKDIIYVNSCRPSVIVMKTSTDDSPRSSIHNDNHETERRTPEYLNYQRVPSYEACHCADDPEATDSDSTTTPPTSPFSFQSAASSDERFSSDSPRSYDSEKPHKCRICGRAFRKHSALIIHHRVHSGEKPYKCPECAKNFSISGNLRRHFLIHTGERPYICPECSRAFNNPSHLTRHRRKLHKFDSEKK